jgi:hypothetical protein
MECLNDYRNIIKTFLEESIVESLNDPNFETQLICDRDRDHYQLVSLGWQGHRRFYSVLIHLDIKDDKVWIQRNDTDRLMAQELMALGIARADIILGLQPAYARADTGYSVA